MKVLIDQKPAYKPYMCDIIAQYQQENCKLHKLQLAIRISKPNVYHTCITPLSIFRPCEMPVKSVEEIDQNPEHKM